MALQGRRWVTCAQIMALVALALTLVVPLLATKEHHAADGEGARTTVVIRAGSPWWGRNGESSSSSSSSSSSRALGSRSAGRSRDIGEDDGGEDGGGQGEEYIVSFRSYLHKIERHAAIASCLRDEALAGLGDARGGDGALAASSAGLDGEEKRRRRRRRSCKSANLPSPAGPKTSTTTTLAPSSAFPFLSLNCSRNSTLETTIPSAAWTIVERTNPAAKYPSDFDVVRVQAATWVERVREKLLSNPLVKSVHANRRYTRAPLHFQAEQDEGADDGEDEDGKGEEEVAWDQRNANITHNYDQENRTLPLVSKHGASQQGCTGRRLTQWSWENETDTREWQSEGMRRKLLRALPQESVTDSLQADELWRLGFSGQGVRVGIFDTGLREGHSHFRNVRARSDWTEEHTLDDGVGHGTFVAGIVSSSSQCLGFAPDAELHIFRVFTNKQVSYTSWFLDALNYAIFTHMHIINLSIGGPDFLDTPFVEKVNELTASNVILVSAIGNDGPLYGTLNNPADMNNVIGVGGITAEEKIAAFSSRGMTLWEQPAGMGRFKPDIVTYSTNIRGSHFQHGCRSLSGTSVASPVVAGAVTLLASVVPNEARSRLVTPASIKQVLVESAVRLNNGGWRGRRGRWLGSQRDTRKEERRAEALIPSLAHEGADGGGRGQNEEEDGKGSSKTFVDGGGAGGASHFGGNDEDDEANIFEQGQGKIDLPAAAILLSQYQPRASIVPPQLDTTDCPYMWPYCEQPLFYGAMPLIANLTILNGMGAVGWVQPPSWYPSSVQDGELVDVSFEYAEVVWPWSGFFAVRVAARTSAKNFKGVAQGYVIFNVTSPPVLGSLDMQTSMVVLPIRIQLIPTPPRQFRILWDQFHSIAYPGGFFPRDSLRDTVDPLDWHGDHPFTNFRGLFTSLRRAGYFVEVLGQPWTCFDATQYGTLLIVDPEEEYFPKEIEKLHSDVRNKGLHVIVLADWYTTVAMGRLKFFDENTHNWWYPETGGANTVALNRVLEGWGFAFGEGSYSGDYSLEERSSSFLSGSVLAAAPAGSTVISALLKNDDVDSERLELLPILGLGHGGSKADAGTGSGSQGSSSTGSVGSGVGRVAIYGDSGCVDDATRLPEAQRCDWLLGMLLEYVHSGHVPAALSKVGNALVANFSLPLHAPAVSPQSTLHLYSRVLADYNQWRPLPTCPTIHWSRASVLPNDLRDAVLAWASRLDNRTSAYADAVETMHSGPWTRGALADSPVAALALSLLALLLLAAIVLVAVRSRLWRSVMRRL